MTDTPTPAPLDIQPGKPGLLQRLSLVWLVPLIALAASLWVAWDNYTNQGTLIEIAFENASGIKAEETEVKYKDVTIGRVESVEFAEGLGEVLVHARIDPTIAPYLDQDASFWVVRPDVSVRGISGLDTVLSGVYIEGSWNDEPDVQQYAFVGLEEPPIARVDQAGVAITLRTKDGSSLTSGAPILHKGIQVGYLETPRLSADGQSVTVSAFVDAPYDRRITTNTRFWDTSGFSISLGAGGIALNVNSIASLIEGGIAFDTIVSGGEPVEDGDLFDLFESEEVARNSLFDDPDLPVLNLAILFDGSVSGLTAGAEVRFRGVRVGTVTDLSAVAVEDRVTGPLVQLRTIIAVEPGRMGLSEEATPEDALILITDMVRTANLRARLVTGNILSGALNVELYEDPNAERAFVNLGAEPYPVLPTTDNAIADVGDEAQTVLDRVNDLPIEELLTSAIDLMDSLDQVVRSEGVSQAPDEIVALLQSTREIVASEDMQAIPTELRAIVTELNGIVGDAGEADLVGRIGEVVDTAGVAVANIDAATQNLPALTAEIEALVAKANALEVEALITEATATLNQIDGFIATEAMQAAPEALVGLVDEARGLIASEDLQAIPTDLRRVVGQIDGILTTLAEADVATQLTSAINAANSAAASIDTAATDLPAITAELNALAARANTLDLEGLVTATSETLNSINALVGADTTQDLPASLSVALDEMAMFLAEVREGGAITNVNAALASAADAAQAIETAAASLPALSARATALVGQTDAVLQSYGERSRFNAETMSTLRDIQEAADAVSSLARAIQRNPNSLLTGR